VTRRAAIGGLAGLTATSLGCTRRHAASTHIDFWAFGREGEVAEELIEDFLVEHPGFEVQIQKLPWISAHEKLLTAFAGDTLPDLCQLGNTWLPEFAALNALEPLNAFVSGSGTVRPEDYFAGIWEANRLDDTLYGVPWYVDTRLMYYRRDLLQQAGFASPPRTWDEWMQMLAAIKQLVGPKNYSVLLPLNEFEPLVIFALQMPEPVLRDAGRWGNFRGPEFRRVLTFYNEMFTQGWAPRMTNTEISNYWDEFGRGYFSFYISGPWNIAEFKRRLPPHLQDAWMTAPMPGPGGPGVSMAGGASLVIFKSSQSKQAAWKLAEYLSRPPVQQRFYELVGDMPPRRATWATPELSQSMHARAFFEQLDRVRSPPKVPEWERIATEMRLAAERVIQGRSTVDQAVVSLDRTVDAILEKRRWMLDRRPST
jgi:multiple sugar transport system substrate-binding protein